MSGIAAHDPAALSYDDKDEKRRSDSIDKGSYDSNEKKGVDDAQVVADVEAFEERLQRDEAADEEYLISDAADVALKVGTQYHPRLFCLLTADVLFHRS